MVRLFFFLLAACCGLASAGQASFSPAADLGNIMYVGDSITHGVDAASYRWPLFKIWVDNGITQKEVGVNVGNWRGGVAAKTPYGGALFLNVHSAISSQRAYEIAGRLNTSGRLGNSSIRDWLGLNKGYTGRFRIDPATQMPDTFILLIGTNDTLSDAGQGGIYTCLQEKQQNLLGRGRGKRWKREGDLYAIISAMRAANPGARVAVCTIPCWMDGRNNNDTAEDFASIARYNEALKAWGKYHNIAVVEVNRGLTDQKRAAEKPFVGAPSMFVRDRLHPSAQGDLIIAGNIAQQLGFAGRTAGLERKAAEQFPQLPGNVAGKGVSPGKGGSLSLAARGQLVIPAKSETGASVELDLCGKGMGSVRKADARPLRVNLVLADGTWGQLTVDATGLAWQGRCLYSADMSKLSTPIRLVWMPGNPAVRIPGGFYIWLGDMLVGEALPGEASSEAPGLGIMCGDGAIPALRLHYDPAAAWAPPSKRFSAAKQ